SRTTPSGLTSATCTPSSARTTGPRPSPAPGPSACWHHPRCGAGPRLVADGRGRQVWAAPRPSAIAEDRDGRWAGAGRRTGGRRRTSSNSSPIASTSVSTPYSAARSASGPVSTVSPPLAVAPQGGERGAHCLAQVAADPDPVPVRRPIAVGTGHVLTTRRVHRPAGGCTVLGTCTLPPLSDPANRRVPETRRPPRETVSSPARSRSL